MRSKNSGTELQRQTDLGNAGEKNLLNLLLQRLQRSPSLSDERLFIQLAVWTHWTVWWWWWGGGFGERAHELHRSCMELEKVSAVAAVLNRNGCMAEWTNGRLSWVKDTRKGCIELLTAWEYFRCAFENPFLFLNNHILPTIKTKKILSHSRCSTPNICNPFQWLETCDLVTW